MKTEKLKKLINPWNIFGETPFSKKINFWVLFIILVIFGLSFYSAEYPVACGGDEALAKLLS